MAGPNTRSPAIASTPPRSRADEWLPPAAIAVLGIGAVVALAGTAAGDPRLTLAGGGLAAVAVLLLMVGEAVDPLVALVLTLPLPALYATASVRLAPAAPMTALVIAAWVLGSPARTTALRLARLPVLPIAALLFAFVLAGLVSPHRVDAIREIANLGVLLLLLVVATDLVARVPGRAFDFARAVAAVGAVTGTLAVLEALRILPGQFPEPGGFNRAALGFGQPNGLGMFLALSLPYIVHVRTVAHGRLVRWAATLALAATVGGLIGTLSRGSWLSVLAGATVLPLAGGGWRFTLRVWGAALIAALVVDVASGGVIREAVAGLLRDWSVAQRAALMLAGVRMFLDHPLLGVGPGGFLAELERIGLLVPMLRDIKPTPHNAYIQMAAETGIVGLTAFVVFLIALFRRAVRLARSSLEPADRSLHLAVVWSLAIAVAEGMVEWPFSHGHGQLVMLTGAFACALPLKPSGRSPESEPEEAGP